MEARMACGLAKCQTRSCGRMTSWSRSTPLVSTCWIPKSETESSNSFCRIASRSFWAMRWLGSSSESDLECGDSSQATRSMRGQMTIESVLSRNSLRSKKMPWRRSQKTSPWKTLLANDIVNRMKIMQQPDLAKKDVMPVVQSEIDVSCHEACS